MDGVVGSVRQIPYGPWYQVLSIEPDGVHVAVEFPESEELITLTMEEVLATPLKE